MSYSAAIDKFVGKKISSQTDFRIVIGTSNNPQNNIVRVIYIDIPTLRHQSPGHVGPSCFGFR